MAEQWGVIAIPAKTHGESRTRLYTVWQDMKARCYRKSASCYSSYGGRGIAVCDEWKHDYVAFKEWSLSNGYNKDAPYGECTLDRIDVNGDYCPSNCRWVSNMEQQSNRRDNVYITYHGITMTVAQWARKLCISENSFRKRIEKWGVEKAIERPLVRDNRLDLVGQKFGRLYVASRVEKPNVKNRRSYFTCVCDCGNEVVVQGHNLVNGLTKSCGCLVKEINSIRLHEIMSNRPPKFKYEAVRCMNLDGAVVAEYKNVPEAAAAIGVNNSQIYKVLNEPTKTCRGMKWESLELNCAH